jgi:poly-gamma-glutamate synthesis protein (capsule biosynthesis protein)
MLGRTINSKAIETNNFEYPFLPTKTFLTSADISFVNLETPILKNCPIKPTGTVFCASASWISAIENSGIDVLSLANNHTLDHQKAGFDETLSLLLSQNLWVTGSDFDVVKEVNGVKFGFLSFNDISPTSPEKLVVQRVPILKTKADVVIVSFHFGNEYTHTPSSRQRLLAHKAIDLGADVIVGHHPHWIQPVEIYKDKPIIYSHGNFIFDQYWSTKTRQGMVSKLTFYDQSLVDLELIPISIDLTGTPSISTGNDVTQILNYIRSK